MKYFASHSILRFTLTTFLLIAAFLACAPASYSQTTLDKHARKIHKKLVRYRSGSYLHLVLDGKADNYGALGTVTDASFTFTSADTNAVSTYSYDDVAKVKTDREPIGKGSEPDHHYFRPRTLIVAGALVVGAGAAAMEVR